MGINIPEVERQKALSIMPATITSIKKERAKHLFGGNRKSESSIPAYEAKEQATRLLTAKLRAEGVWRAKQSVASLTEEGRESVSKR